MTTAFVDQSSSTTNDPFEKMRESAERRKLALQQKKALGKKNKGCVAQAPPTSSSHLAPNLMKMKLRDSMARKLSKKPENPKFFIVTDWNHRGGHSMIPSETGDSMVYRKEDNEEPYPTPQECQGMKSWLADEMLGTYINTCIGMVKSFPRLATDRVEIFERICEVSFDQMWRNYGEPALSEILSEEFDVFRMELLQKCQSLVFACGERGIVTMRKMEDMVDRVVEKTSAPESRASSKKPEECKMCEKCNEAEKEAEKKAKKCEKKADELEKKMKKMEKEMEQMRRQLSRKDEEIEKLRVKISKKNETEKQLRAAKNDLTIKNQSLELEVSTLKQENEQLNLRAPPMPVITDWSEKLLEFQKIKNDINKNSQLGEARSMVDRLLSTSDCAETERLAKYELNQIEKSTRIFLEVLELNIQKIEETQDCSDLIPLWELPVLSDDFLEKYRIEMEKKPAELSADTHCFICFEKKREGNRILRCKGCKKEVHEECGRQWLMTNPTCAFCRRKMVIQRRYSA